MVGCYWCQHVMKAEGGVAGFGKEEEVEEEEEEGNGCYVSTRWWATAGISAS